MLCKMELKGLSGAKVKVCAIISPVRWMAEEQVQKLLHEALSEYHSPFPRKEETTMAKKKVAKKAAAPKAAKPAKAAKKKAKK